MANRDLIGRTLGEYVLREPIGQGGGGLIYRSRQPTLDRDLVVKVLREPARDTTGARERFLREAQLASRLRHHYATHIYAFGVEADGLRWIAMEMVHGVSFEHWLRQHGPMSLEQFVPLFERVAEVVHAAHQLGIVHRDLKPSNVMVIEDHGGLLVPKLLDFGIAKISESSPELAGPLPERWADGSLGENVDVEVPPADAVPDGERPRQDYITRTDPGARAVGFTPMGAAIGSFPYMSPEQKTDARSVGPAADIFSLGVLAYQALHGHLPPPPMPRPRGALEVPAALDRIFARALACAPADRHPTAVALAADLRAALESSEREQLRASARQWETGDRAPGLLWGLDMLARFEASTRRTSSRALDPSELAFIAHSQRRARRSRWGRRLLISLAAIVVLGALGGLQLYTSMKARLAQDQVDAAEQLVTQLEVEQGRQALRDNAAEAKVHLANAYRRGDHSDGTKFMLARALQSDRAQLARLPGRGGRMWSARFSPSGDTIVTTDDQSAQLWDARTYQLRFALPHGDTVYDAVFSHDGKTLYTAVGDGTIGVWDTATGASRRSLRTTGKPPRYYLMALSPDEHMVAAIDTDGATASVWDTGSGTQLAAIVNDGTSFPSIAFTSDSQWLATTGGDEARVFDVHTWAKTFTLPHARKLIADPTIPHIATASVDGDISIWEVPSGKRLRHLREVGDPVDRLAFSPDGALLAGASPGPMQIWDAHTGKLVGQPPGRQSKVYSLEFDRT